VVLTFSEDFELMSLYNVQKDEIKVYSMKDLVSILKGLQTDNFLKYRSITNPINDKCCFSLSFKERSFDFAIEAHLNRE
jgi:hypothetical protein